MYKLREIVAGATRALAKAQALGAETGHYPCEVACMVSLASDALSVAVATYCGTVKP